MVHGIGQRLEKSNLVDDVATFRQITASLAERHLTSYQRGSQRVLFIPCQVGSALKFLAMHVVMHVLVHILSTCNVITLLLNLMRVLIC